MSELGFGVTRQAAMLVTRTGGIILSGAFAIIDVYSLIDSFKKQHPTVEALAEYISMITNELNNIKELKQIVDDL